MRSDLLDALSEAEDRPSTDETNHALRLVRRRRARRRAAAITMTATVAIAIIGVTAALIATTGQQIVADGPATEATSTGQTPNDPRDESGDDIGPLEPRFGASVAWTGTEMIVTGGFRPSTTNEFNDAEFFVDSAAYNPTSGLWRPIADQPPGPMTSPATVWTGDRLLVIGAAGVFAYDPSVDEWTILPDPPFALPDLVRDNELFETAWSKGVLYVWRPGTDQMAIYTPDENRWQAMPSPDMDAFPANLLGDDDRLVALGTGWPSSGVPISFEVEVAEWIDGEWRSYDPVTFVTENNSNVADVDAAALVDGKVIVWGDHSDDPGPTYLLDGTGNWTEAPPMPIDAGMGHPGSVLLDGRLLALSEGSEVAIFEPTTLTWTTAELPSGQAGGPAWPGAPASQAVWSGTDLLAWTGSSVLRWNPLATPQTEPNNAAPDLRVGDRFVYPGGCGPAAFGTAGTHSPDVLEQEALPSWTRSEPGRWLESLIGEAGFGEPFDAGSAFVLAHGVDGSAFIWFGPEQDTANLDLSPTNQVDANVLSGTVEPVSPFDGTAYRPPSVFTTSGGGVRFWLLINPRDAWEETNFPGLTGGAPCLPDDQALVDAMLAIASKADQNSYQGTIPDSAGRFAINSDVGASATDPGDRHLIDIAAQVLDAPLRQPGSAAVIGQSTSRWIFTGTPPYETNPNTLAGGRDRDPIEPRATAGGLDILFWLQEGPGSLSDAELADLQRIAAGLNSDPFLGQPTPG